MKKQIRAIILVLLCPVAQLYGQLTIDECRELALKNYPLVRQYNLIELAREYNISNADKGYLPQFTFSGKASYQSEVTSLPVTLPGVHIKEIRKDQYQAALELSQTLWDGGTIRAGKSAADAGAATDIQSLETEIYAIKDRINQLFFAILLQDEQLKQNALLQDELARNYRQVEAYVANGIAGRADLDAVRVEQLNTSQQEIALAAGRKAYGQMLSAWIGQPADSLIKPRNIRLPASAEIKRPELSLYDTQDAQLEVQKSMLRAKNRPRLDLFAQGLYGNPGLNMLKNEFSFDYLAGIRLAWNFGTLYTRKNEHRLIENNRDRIRIQRDIFLFNTNLQLTRQHTEAEKLIRQMKDDDEIITLRTRIRQSAEAKVANGTLSVTEMLREVTAENQARLNKAVHEIQLLLTICDLKNTTNN